MKSTSLCITSILLASVFAAERTASAEIDEKSLLGLFDQVDKGLKDSTVVAGTPQSTTATPTAAVQTKPAGTKKVQFQDTSANPATNASNTNIHDENLTAKYEDHIPKEHNITTPQTAETKHVETKPAEQKTVVTQPPKDSSVNTTIAVQDKTVGQAKPEQKKIETNAVEKPVENKPAQANPNVQQNPDENAEKKVTEVKPVEQKVENKPTQANPTVQLNPANKTPVEKKVAEAKPAEQKPANNVDPNAGDSRPVQALTASQQKAMEQKANGAPLPGQIVTINVPLHDAGKGQVAGAKEGEASLQALVENAANSAEKKTDVAEDKPATDNNKPKKDFTHISSNYSSSKSSSSKSSSSSSSSSKSSWSTSSSSSKSSSSRSSSSSSSSSASVSAAPKADKVDPIEKSSIVPRRPENTEQSKTIAVPVKATIPPPAHNSASTVTFSMTAILAFAACLLL